MSTDAQIKGDSLRRQLDLSERYAREHRLDLVTDFELRDLGVSAFTGENSSTGALGRFLIAIREKRIAAGSYLLVESFDRLSRQRPHAALTQFLEIINAGIVLVTLADGRVYTPENASLENLLYSIIVMTRAHEESATKSHRIGAAWDNKRKNIAQKKLTGRCPAWLQLTPDRSAFVVNEERRLIIQRIFAEATAGIGAYSIARRLNAAKEPAFVGSNGWHTSSVNKILTNRAVLGEFQPHRLIAGQRKPEGLPIPGYFPAVINEDDFYSAQAQRSQRRTSGGGRKGAFVSNLFSKLARCHYCRGPMRFENKGRRSNRSPSLVCDTALRGKGCRAIRWGYRDFETSFLAFVEEVDLGSLLEASDTPSAASCIADKISKLTLGIGRLETEQKNAYDLLQSGDADLPYVRARLTKCESEIASCQNELASLQAQQIQAKHETLSYYDSRSDLRDLIVQLGSQLGADIYRLRSQVSMRLQSILTSLTLSPAGGLPIASWETAERSPNDPSFDVDLYMGLDDPLQGRYFVACFRDGTFRAVYPADSDAFQFHQQIVKKRRDFYLLEGDAGLTEPIDLEQFRP